MKMTDHTIGVAISKSSLDVFDSKRQEVRRFDNTDAGFGDLSKWLVSHSPSNWLRRLGLSPLCVEFTRC